MKNQLKKLAPFALVGILSGATTFGAINYFNEEQNNTDFSYFTTSGKNAIPAGLNGSSSDSFVKASKTTVPAVVTIRNYQNNTPSSGRSMDQDIFEFFFGEGFRNNRSQRQEAPKDLPSGLGSGVIISSDGYIISNNHVVAGASKLEVVLSNKKTYTATLIGTDPSTDIALLKIEDKGLPYLNFANSDLVEVGQWVLAVGNPLGLNSTVTAGIVSAKGRSIDLLSQQSRTPIESFIQTDAAINKGNSGGALVNLNGDLIGINSAISSSSGYYEGYGFAVPANLAKKVGGEKWANELVTSINNAASAAVPGAADVFSGVIKNMSDADVKKVLEGGKDSFTKFLQQNSSQKLQAVFKPIITKMMSDNTFATAYNGLNSFVAGSALAKSDAAKQLKGIATSMGAGEYIPQENEDLNDYITRKTLDGLFNVMSEKESSLRGGAVEQGTKILQGIFK